MHECLLGIDTQIICIEMINWMIVTNEAKWFQKPTKNWSSLNKLGSIMNFYY